jgi:NAD(P)-dependent dehydrogenase (short-subunit alcohol dehydrogenase family)
MLAAEGLTAFHLDLASPEAVERGANELLESFTSFDAVFLNAGYASAGAIEDLPCSAWERQFQVNLFGHLQLLRVLLQRAALQPGARIVWCSSVLAITAMPMRGAYSASKAAMEAVADAQRIELAHKGIHVSILQPGPILTNFRGNSLAALRATVDVANSAYAEAYKATIARLSKQGPASPGTLPSEAAARVLLSCLQASKPKARYAITRNTTVMAWLKRLLPSSMLDRVIRHAAGAEALPCLDTKSR